MLNRLDGIQNSIGAMLVIHRSRSDGMLHLVPGLMVPEQRFTQAGDSGV
jgi:hypothetical protein